MSVANGLVSIYNETSMAQKVSIVKLQKLPPEFRKVTQEPNLLEYKDNEILVALDGEEVIGSVRLAIRAKTKEWGLITGLMVDNKHRNKGIEEKLIKSAEDRLNELKVRQIDGVCRDGVGHVRYFYRSGYKPFRRTVFIEWALAGKMFLEINPEFKVEGLNPYEGFNPYISEVILNSLQPYWTTWKEKADKKNQELRIKNQGRELIKDKTYRIFTAYHNGEAVGLVDARTKEPNLVFGVTIRKDFKGRKLGSTLLHKALSYLRDLGIKKAFTVSTSGLDDYDPQIYLYTLSGGKIIKEYIDLKKTF